MRISLEKLPFSDWKHGRTAALLRDLPYFPFTFRVLSVEERLYLALEKTTPVKDPLPEKLDHGISKRGNSDGCAAAKEEEKKKGKERKK